MIRIDTLPAAQRRFWEQDTPQLPIHWVLYGGTAIALQQELTRAAAWYDARIGPLPKRSLRLD